MSTELQTNGASAPTTLGFLRGLPPELYHAIDACSNSRLSKLKQSPAHLRYSLDNQDDDTDAQIVGRALHAAIMEPEMFHSWFVAAPKVDRRTTAGKAIFADFQAKHANKTLLTAEQMERVEGMSRALHTHESASLVIQSIADAELSAVWIDQALNLLCKARLDAVSPELETIIDIKTTTDASRHEFERSIFKFGYHRQAAMYLDACATLGKPQKYFTIIAIEKEPPHGLAVYRLVDEIIELGRKEIRPLMALYKRCQAADEWPGYPVGVQDIGIPAWAKKRIEEESE